MPYADGRPSKVKGDGKASGKFVPTPKRHDLTKDMLERVFPRNARGNITDEHLETINGLIAGDLTDTFRDNILGFGHVLKEGKFKIDQYISAVKYVSFKMLGSSNIEAYVKVFPERYQSMLNNGYTERQIGGVVSVYNKGSLVTKIFEQNIVPVHIVNADLHQKAINQLAYLMMNARSEKVQSDSAAKLVDALKVPETTKIELDVSVGEDQSIRDLRATTMELVAQQRAAIKAGAQTAKEIAHSKIISENVVEGEIVG